VLDVHLIDLQGPRRPFLAGAASASARFSAASSSGSGSACRRPLQVTNPSPVGTSVRSAPGIEPLRWTPKRLAAGPPQAASAAAQAAAAANHGSAERRARAAVERVFDPMRLRSHTGRTGGSAAGRASGAG